MSPLACGLEHFSLDNHPSYLALSYVWGDNKVSTRLKCNDGYLHITKNLEAALFNLRSTRKPRWIWVDAICIHQNDLDEKAAQIQNMRRVYAQAMQTIVWLGEAGDDGFLAATLIHTLHHYMIQHPEWKGKLLDDDLSTLGIDSRSRPLLWQALGRFYNRPYFRRVWVMQEVAVSKNLMVIFGSMTLDYGYLEKVTNAMPAQFTFQNYVPDTIFNLRGTYQKLISENLTLPLSYLIFWDPRLQATVSVDKIYAWLGLSDEAQNPAFQPDYRSNERSVFLRTGRNLLLRHIEDPSIGILSPLYLLSAAGINKGSHSPFPTWLSIPPSANTPKIAEQHLLGRKQRFSVSGLPSPRLRFSDDSEILYVYGRKLDCIKALGPKMGSLEKQDGNDVQVKGLNSIYAVLERERFAFAQKHAVPQDVPSHIIEQGPTRRTVSSQPEQRETTHQRDPSRLPWEEVYWRTVILNLDDTGNVAVPEFGKYLDDWYEEIRHQEWEKNHLDPQQCPFDHSFKRGSFVWSLAANNANSYQRTMFATQRGYIGLGRPTAEVGDVICFLYGGAVPMILRPQGSHYLLVGDCYIHEIMDGEALQWPGIEDEEFEIY